MRISDAPAADQAAKIQPAGSPAKQSEPAAAPSAAQDEVSVGPVALAASNSLNAPESRIAELRQQVLDGTYTVDPAVLSAKIVDEHLDK